MSPTSNHTLHVVEQADDLINFFDSQDIESGNIPARKIFHSILKRAKAVTILQSHKLPPALAERFEQECDMYGRDRDDI